MSRPAKLTSTRYDVEHVFAFIVGFKSQNDRVSPTIREIQTACGISSTSVTTWLLEKLEAAGKVKVLREMGARSIMVVGGHWDIAGKGKVRVKEGKGRPPQYGRVVFDPSGDFSGKAFKLEELRAMVKNRSFEAGTVYELDGETHTVGGHS